ncbi:XRE family transcriptional regulator [Actinokineospora xionganensis]|uniref:XRE family transcriptional regulator n=1 Tax=Actinokineospora xionganensis TaxID=2684470 RepID=A0ABR7LE40_9PSEU|nr:XRE family transcriptional regulator [Actinokineospora xionganensis]MBC6450577.1 XRE family transcriptional regulator [Actinokineospora xionganensis]
MTDELVPARPFAEALRSAIHAGGVTLDRLAERLRERGTPVSLATLSYWQSGRSQPERPQSLAALANVEHLLGLRSGELGKLLESPKPRGRAVHRTPEPIDSAAPWSDPEGFDRMVVGVDISQDNQLTRLSVHDLIVVGADRAKHVQRTRQVLRAEQDGVDRLVIVAWGESPDEPVPEVVPVRNCAIGRVSRDDRTGQVATELLFGHTLAKRETVLIEHEIRCPEPLSQAYEHERVSRLPVREYLIEVRFDPATPPLHVVRFSDVDGKERVKALTLDSAHTAHTLAMDLEPGRYGVRWSWG